MQSGIILIWSGPIVSIPSGYVICDGNNGTPDLRDMFVVGAGSTYNPDDTGGSVNHTHAFTGSGHTHTLQAGTGVAQGVNINPQTDSQQASGTTDPGASLPPYYSLAYIMKT